MTSMRMSFLCLAVMCIFFHAAPAGAVHDEIQRVSIEELGKLIDSGTDAVMMKI